MRGRKPTSTTQKRLTGNAGKRALNANEPQPPALEANTLTAVPAELTGQPAAIAEWERLAPMLQKCQQITEADRAALLALCLEWARYLFATERVRTMGMLVKAPSGYPIVNPYLSIATKALAGCSKLWPELGLTPSSRSRVTVTGPGPGGDAFSEFDAAPPLQGKPH